MGVLPYGRDGIRGRMFPADRVNWGAVGAVRARVLRAPGYMESRLGESARLVRNRWLVEMLEEERWRIEI